MKNTVSKVGEEAVKNNFVARCGYSNGTVRMKVHDGAGKSLIQHVFSAGITDKPTQFSDTIEYNPEEKWSNGSDTRAIEAKLRARKKEFSYIEVKTHGGKRRGAGRHAERKPK